MTGQDTQVCNLLVKVDGKEEIKATDTETWKLANGAQVVALSVDQRLDCPDSFELEFVASEDGTRTVFDYAKDGAQIELGFGYDKPIKTLFKGEIIYIETEMSAEHGERVILRGFDHSHRLTRGQSAKTWGDGTKEDQDFSQAVSDVITDAKAGKGGTSHGLAPSTIDKTDAKVRYIPKAMTSDYDFIKWAGSNLARATDSGQTDGKKISFRKLDSSGSPVATVCHDKKEGSKPILSTKTRFTITTYPMYAKVRVHGWNNKDKKAFVAEIESASSNLDFATANSGWTAAWQAAGKAVHNSGSSGAVYERVAEFCESKEEAEKIAQGLFDAFSLKHFTGEIEVEGCPDIAPGVIVEFKGFGRFDGKVLVTQATHRLSAGKQAYLTNFQFCANASKAAK